MGQSDRGDELKSLGLKPDQLRVLALYYYDNRSQWDIAIELGCSQAWVSKLLAAGCRKILRAGLPLPQKRKAPKVLICSGEYLDTLYKDADGRYKPSHKPDGLSDTKYNPFN